jgi:peptide/nickel transport system permease protein
MKPIIKKLRFLVLVLLGLVSFIFVLFQALPSADQILSAQRSDSATTAAIVKDLGLDKPIWEQGFYYLNDLSPISVHRKTTNTTNFTGGYLNVGDYQIWLKLPYLRTSFQTKQKVSSMLVEAFYGTLVLAIAAMLISMLIGIPLGIWAAIKQNTWIDKLIVWLSAIGISVPSFFSAMIFSWLFGFVLIEYTHLPMTGSLFEIDSFGNEKSIQISHLILPALALGIRPLAVFIQLTRNTMVEILQLDFIRTARAKGISESVVIWRHAFPNALNPLITSIGGWFSSLLAGSFFTEYIFQWKGLGKVTIEALQQSDLPVVMGAVLFTACVFFVIHTLTELLYVWIDPRMNHE